VNGPRTLVQSISIARVFVDPEDLEWTEGTLLATGEIRLFNRASEEVNSPLLSITTEGTTIDTVLIEGTVMPTKSFSVSDLIETQGTPAKGYKVVSTKVSPENITVAARNEVMEQMNQPALDRVVNVQDLSETTVFQIKVQKPSEDAVLSNDTVTVTVEIVPDAENAE
jgi:YbbR domain-containing protein